MLAVRWDKKGGKRVLGMLIAVTLLLPLAPIATSSGAGSGATDETLNVIVQATKATLGDVMGLVKSLGGSIERRLGIINSLEVEIPSSALQQLQGDPRVQGVTPNGKVEMLQTINCALTPTSWYEYWLLQQNCNGGSTSTSPTTVEYDASGRALTGGTHPKGVSMRDVVRVIGADYAWKAGITGKGIDVALIDTGVSPVTGLATAGKVVNGPDLSFDSQVPSLRYLDAYGHGTHMAGLIAGNDSGSLSYSTLDSPTHFAGVAPGARIVNVKVGATDGSTDISQVIAAIDWVVQNRNKHGLNIQVLNLSFGTDSVQPYEIDPLSHAAEVAWRKGIFVVAAGGNDGTDLPQLSNPANDPYLLAVGAVDVNSTLQRSDDKIPAFASRSTTKRNVDVVAPGAHILGLRVPGSFVDQEFGGGATVEDRYFLGSGTSQAAAVVSGFAALMLEKFPRTSPDQLKQALLTDAKSVPGAIGKPEQGFGMIRGDKAFANKKLPGGRKSPRYTVSTGTGSLQEARGTMDPVYDGVKELLGEFDIFGQPWDGASWATAATNERSWNGGLWRGTDWSGSAFSGASWAAIEWTKDNWNGRRWKEMEWADGMWDGRRWSGRRWKDDAWSGRRWKGRRWSSAGWGDVTNNNDDDDD